MLAAYFFAKEKEKRVRYCKNKIKEKEKTNQQNQEVWNIYILLHLSIRPLFFFLKSRPYQTQF